MEVSLVKAIQQASPVEVILAKASTVEDIYFGK